MYNINQTKNNSVKSISPNSLPSGGSGVGFRLYRYEGDDKMTHGHLFVKTDGALKQYVCDTLEPAVRKKKIPGKTAIKEGTYKVVMSPSQKFHRMMPFLMDVPQFKGVMIHTGNYVSDTQGCIIVGVRDKDMVKSSRVMFNKLMGIIKDADNVKIEVVNGKEIEEY